jgi:hypothetical protein
MIGGMRRFQKKIKKCMVNKGRNKVSNWGNMRRTRGTRGRGDVEPMIAPM